MAKEEKKAFVPKLRFPEFRGSTEWKAKRMDSLYSFMRNNTLSRDKLNYEAGTAKNIHYGDIHTKFSTLFDITKERVPFINVTEELPDADADDYCVVGDLIFADSSEDTNDVGKCIEIVRLYKQHLLAGQHTILARQRNGEFVIGFGGRVFQSARVRSQIQHEAQGTKVYAISPTRLARIKVAYPGDEDEQQKIADCLSSLDEFIAAQRRKVEALKTYKRGLMQQLFPREGETLPLLRFSNEGDWTEADLPEVAFFQEGPGIMAVDFCTEGVPLVRLAGVGGSVVTLDGCNYLDPEKVARKWSHFRLAVNDLVISTSATFGLTSLVTDAAEGAVFYTGLIRFRPSTQSLDSGYLKAFLGSPCFERQVESAAVGGGIKHFGPSHIKRMAIPLPPLPEQQRIANCLDALDNLITAETQKSEALKSQKTGLMQQLFPSLEEV